MTNSRISFRSLLICFSLALTLSPLSNVMASGSEGSPEETTSSSGVSLTSEQRMKNLVLVAETAIKEISGAEGKNPEYMKSVRGKINKLIDTASENGFPIPVGVSVGVTTEAGFGIAGSLATELVFLMEKNGTLAFGVFPSVALAVGVGADLNHGVFLNLIFNIDKLDNYVGAVAGFSADLGLIKSTSSQVAVGVEGADVEKVKAIIEKALKKEHRHEAMEELKEMVGERRLLVVGTTVGVGIGAKVMAFAAYGDKIYETTVALDSKAITQVIREAKPKLKNMTANQTQDLLRKAGAAALPFINR